ncbi:carbohydrate porin [Thalassotalea sp. Y01]|uniref:carbohydrate porin n=1 Tax=Thalassotalea sp. Y01 TaxID=2729613 RepID=UPI00145C3CC7|nr:carbohydrate porin [Thalassotalea sp. Y01]NMP14757.1 carbohydrate porin [Thalassotalea sp. Y01]
MNKSLIVLTIAGLFATSVNAKDNQRVGSPDSTEHAIKDAKHEPRLSWKESLEKNYGLSIASDYNSYYVQSNDVMDGADDNAASGVFRIMGSWAATENGSLNFKIEHRHAYTDQAPKWFGLNDVGMGSMTGANFSDQGARVTNLYWRQNFGDTVLWVGFLDITDYLDAYAQASPWTDFTNLTLGTGNGTMGLPDDAAFGIAAGHMLTDNLYVLGGVVDATGKSDLDEFTDNVDAFLSENVYHKSIEFGYTGAGQGRIYLDNVHVSYWHQDEGSRHDPYGDSEGVNFSASLMMGKWMPFFRASVSDGYAPLLSESVTVGTGYYGLFEEKDTLGFAYQWGKANEEQFGHDDDQYIGQVYYKMPITDYFQVIPDIQYVDGGAMNKAMGNDKGSQVVFGLRARIIL